MWRADGPPPSPKEEGDRLKGTWVSRGPDHELQIYFGPGRTVQISLTGPEAGPARNAHGPLSEVKEDERGRYVEMHKYPAEATDLPRRLYFRFDGEKLVLDIGEGKLKGQHAFTRKPSEEFNPWAALVVVVISSVVAAVVFVARWRRWPRLMGQVTVHGSSSSRTSRP